MKKSHCFIFLLISCSSFGQKFSGGLFGGFGIGVNRDVVITTVPYSSPVVTKISFGTGLNLGLNFDCQMNKYFTIGTDFIYHNGGVYSYYTQAYSYSHSGGNYENYDSKTDITLGNISQLQINPSIKFSLGKVVKPYVKFGAVIGAINRYRKVTDLKESGKSHVQIGASTYRDTSYTNIVHKKVEYSGLSAGFNSGLGIDFLLGERFYFFAELDYVYMSWSPRRNNTTEYTINDVDQLGGSPSSKRISSETRAYSSVNAMIGIRYVFEKLSEKAFPEN